MQGVLVLGLAVGLGLARLLGLGLALGLALRRGGVLAVDVRSQVSQGFVQVGRVSETLQPTFDPMPQAVVESAAADVGRVLVSQWQLGYIQQVETEPRRHDIDALQVGPANGEIAILRTKIVAQRIEPGDTYGCTQLLQHLQDGSLTCLVSPDENGLRGLDVEPSCVADAAILLDARSDETHEPDALPVPDRAPNLSV